LLPIDWERARATDAFEGLTCGLGMVCVAFIQWALDDRSY